MFRLVDNKINKQIREKSEEGTKITMIFYGALASTQSLRGADVWMPNLQN